MPDEQLLILFDSLGAMAYRCVATSRIGFVQQLACSYLRHGYWWYVSGHVPSGKAPEKVDEKLIEKYEIAVSESTRARRKKLGKANLQYIRHGQFFLILATKGNHVFKDEERNAMRDARRIPIKFGGYSISYRQGGRTRKGEKDAKWHSHVQIERDRYKELEAYFLEIAKHRSVDNLALAFYRIPFEPYAPVRRQLLLLLRKVNKVRRLQHYSPVPTEVLPMKRRIVKPFV